MSRVNVETRALAESRLFDFAEGLKLERWQAIGLLVYFWHDSQARKVWKGTRDQVSKFIPVKPADRPRFFDALLAAEYISPLSLTGNVEFLIRGNKKHVQALANLLEARSKAGSKGGKRSSEIRSETKKLSPSKRQATDEANDQQVIDFASRNATQHNAKRSDSIQGVASQDNSTQNSNTLAEGADGPPSSRGASASPRGAVVELLGNEAVTELLLQVTQETQKSWLKAYPSPEWIKQEILLANVWMHSNPHKRPKQFARFMSNWFNRAFEQHRKGLPSRRQTASEVNAQAALDLYDRNQKGTL